MKKLTSSLMATALIGTIALTSFTSVASASDSRRGPGARAAGPIHFVCAPRAAERIEIRLSYMAERIDLTEEQTPAFEAFKTALLDAQNGFASVCAEVKPDRSDRDTGLIERLNARQALISAQADALKSVLPSFENFFNTLSEEQKHQMRPHRARGPHRPHPGMMRNGPLASPHSGPDGGADAGPNADTDNMPAQG
ncbi:MAG TPA: hypothetical protein ENJ68_05195 [Devosia sp.]|nr:hypothetical protein [Devosia sp.]